MGSGYHCRNYPQRNNADINLNIVQKPFHHVRLSVVCTSHNKKLFELENIYCRDVFCVQSGEEG
jgi:hypothetical protein